MRSRTFWVLAVGLVLGVATGMAVRGLGTVGAGVPELRRLTFDLRFDANDAPDVVTDLKECSPIIFPPECLVMTDETWKVSKTEYPGWELPEFDDSSWDIAELRSPVGEPHYLNDQMPCLAGLIWAPVPSSVVYFRKRVASSAIDPTALYITVDNEYELWVNGSFIGSDSEWWNTEVYDVSASWIEGQENVIAVKGIDEVYGESAGLSLTMRGYASPAPSACTIAWKRISVPGLAPMRGPNVEFFLEMPDSPDWPEKSYMKYENWLLATPALVYPAMVVRRGEVLIPYVQYDENGNQEPLIEGRGFLVVDFLE